MPNIISEYPFLFTYFSRTVKYLILVFLLLVCVFLSYSNTLQSPFVFDDKENIVGNSFLKIDKISLDTIAFVWSAPHPSKNRKIPNLTFALNHYLNGLNPIGYHLVNIAIHVVCGLLVAQLFFLTIPHLNLLSSERINLNFLAWGSVFCWALHPIQINAVTYIVQRMTSLAALFALLSINFWLIGRNYVPKKILATTIFWVFSVVFWILGLLCKEHVIIVPLLVGVHEFFILQKGRCKIRWHWVWFGSALMLAVSFFYLGSSQWKQVFSGYSHRDFTPVERLMTEARVLWHYISLFFYPRAERFTLLYEYPISTHFFHPITTLFSIVSWVGLIIGAWIFRTKYPVFSWSVGWYLTSHLIESTILPLQIAFEHRMYIPSIALTFGSMYLLLKSLSAIKVSHFLQLCTIVLIVITLGSATYIRNMDFRSVASLYSADLKKYPDSKRLRLNLAIELNRMGKTTEGGEMLGVLSEEFPDDILVLQNWFSYLKIIQKKDLQAERVYQHIQKLLEQDKYVPYRDSKAIWQLSHYFLDHERPEDALDLAKMLFKHFDYDEIWFFVGQCYVRMGDWNSALNSFYEAWKRNPTDPPVLYWYGKSLIILGQVGKGCELLNVSANNKMNEKAAQRSLEYIERYCRASF